MIDKIELIHHGVAASSQPKTVCWMSDNSLIYSSQGILNIAQDVLSFNDDSASVSTNDDVVDDENPPTKSTTDNSHNTLLMHVNHTLRSTIIPSTESSSSSSSSATTDISSSNSRPIITSICEILPALSHVNYNEDAINPFTIVATTLSNGTIHIWLRPSSSSSSSSSWKEYILTHVVSCSNNSSNKNKEDHPHSHDSFIINCIHGKYLIQQDNSTTTNATNDHLTSSLVIILCIASSQGVYLLLVPIILNPTTTTAAIILSTKNHSFYSFLLGSYMTTSLITHTLMDNHNNNNNNNTHNRWDPKLLFISGTANPKGNRIHIHSISLVDSFLQYISTPEKYYNNMDHPTIQEEVSLLSQFIQKGILYHGSLLGHLDWISCFDFSIIIPSSIVTTCNNNNSTKNYDWILASGSHDQRIRLWRFQNESIYTNNTTTSLSSSSLSCLEEEEFSHLNLNEQVEGDEDEDEIGDDNNNIIIEDFDESEARLYIPMTITTTSSTTTVTKVIYKMPITLEAVLMGHEGRVTSVSWRKPRKDFSSSSSIQQQPCLLSSSIDRSILIWMEEEIGNNTNNQNNGNTEGIGVWVPISRVGSAGGIIGGSIGSSLLGYVDATFSPCSNYIVGHAYGGSLHFWVSSQRRIVSSTQPLQLEVKEDESKNVDDKDNNFINQVERWSAAPSITGHFRGVSDISWEPTQGSYLLSVSSDQTCRLWSCIWNEYPLEIWREIARPQVHGYDLNTVACIGDGKMEPLHRFVSGAEEKEIRAFDAPLASLRILSFMQGDDKFAKEDDNFDERVERAFVPALGLSNRYNIDDAMEENDGSGHGADAKRALDLSYNSMSADSGYPSKSSLSDIVEALPFERDLGVISVWPEFRKLFGHQSEVISLASGRNPSLGTILASSCKARDTENAVIRLWDVNRGGCIGILKGHKSSVVSLSFSSDGLYLASAGKDRRLCLWRVAADGSGTYLSSAIEIAHKRIVWSLHFCPTESKILASASRDGTVKVWMVHELDDCTKLVEKLKFEPSCKAGKKVEPVTAVAFAPKAILHEDGHQELLLAIGVEAGLIEIWSVRLGKGMSESIQSIEVNLLQSLPMHHCHFDSVKRLLWKPCNETEEDENVMRSKLTLASCSTDHGVRIFNCYVHGMQ